MSTPADQAPGSRPAPGGSVYIPGRPRLSLPPVATGPGPKLNDEQQLRVYRQMVERANKDIKALESQKQWAGKDKKKLEAINNQIQQVRNSLKDLASKSATLQNKIYEAKGQYEQLLKGESRDAFLALRTAFENYGLGSLAGKIYDFVKNGYGADTISVLLQDTDEYKKRFAANEQRRKAGLSVLSPAEYLAAENSYRQIMRQSGLPKGFYDKNDDFTRFLAGDVSPSELQDRVNLATQASTLANASYKKALQQMGISQGEIAAYFLDQNRALPYIQKAAAKAAIGAEAISRGFEFDQRYAEELATSGISREQAAQAYARIGDEFSTLQSLGSIYGGGWTQRMAEEDIFKGGTEATQQKKRLASQERGQFGGSAGTARGGLGGYGGQK